MVMTDLPIPQQCTRLIMLGHCFGVMKEAIIIGKFLIITLTIDEIGLL
jgi:hypothetical protein